MLASVDAVISQKAALIAQFGAEWHKNAVKEAKSHLHGEHFKNDRVGALVAVALDAAETNKPSNVRQQATGVLMTTSAAGLTSYSSVKKAPHTRDLIVELTARGITEWKHPADHAKAGKNFIFTEMKNMLKTLEIDRVQGKENKELAEKGFSVLSDAEFKMD